MIKKTTLMAAVVIFFAANVAAQHVNLGIKGGLNVFNLRNSANIKYDAKVGGNVGLLGHIHLSKQVGLQPEIMYSAQGARFDALGTDGKIKLDYINIPLNLQYMFSNGFRLQAGPQIGFLVNAKQKFGDTKINVNDNYKKIDFSLTAGIGYVHPPSSVGVDLRYNLGLSNINDISNTDVYNRGVQLGLFYLFNHKN